MDEVQLFIARNQHQLGYIMNEASRQWIKNDPVGAFTVGECNYVIDKYGQYHEILEKVHKYEKALEQIEECISDFYDKDSRIRKDMIRVADQIQMMHRIILQALKHDK